MESSSSSSKQYEKVRVFVMRRQWEEQGVGTLSMFLEGGLYMLQVESTTLRQPVDWKEGLLPAMAVEGEENRAFVMPTVHAAGSSSSGESVLPFPVPLCFSQRVPLTPTPAPLHPCAPAAQRKNQLPMQYALKLLRWPESFRRSTP
jgi:hypothetical protein